MKRLSLQIIAILILILMIVLLTGCADSNSANKPTDNPELERFFAWKGQIACVIDEPFSPETFGPELAVRVKDHLTKLIPLYEYFSRF